MKRFIQFFVLLALPALMTACPGKDSGSNETATTPLSTSCLYGQPGQTTCDPTVYNQYAGFAPYPGAYTQYTNGYFGYWNSYYGAAGGSSVGFCECGPTSYTVYNNSLGLGCISRYNVGHFGNRLGFWGLHPNHQSWSPLPRVGTMPGYGASCTNGVLQACFLSQPSSCGFGLVCRPTSVTSALGICSR